MDDLVNIAEAIRISAPICDFNAHLDYATTTETFVCNSVHEHVINVIPDFTKPDIEDHCNQACQLKNAMDAENFYSFVCACFGHRCSHNIMQIGSTYITHPPILELLISKDTESLKRPSLEFVYLQVLLIMLFTILILENHFLTSVMYAMISLCVRTSLNFQKFA